MSTLLSINPSPQDMTEIKRYDVENFKSTNAKRVPNEELDFSIYKPSSNLVAFSTSELHSIEVRLPLWIQEMKRRYQYGFENHAEVEVRWEEQESSTDAIKCEKISINLLSRKNSENLITITVMLNTGRIQIQGRYISEFNTLLEFINSAGSDLSKSSVQTDLDIFVEKMFSKTHKDKTSSCQIPVT